MVRVNEDGSFSYAGRADTYFVNNDGIRFEAGQVETQMSLQRGIDKCAVVPVLDKRIHDTVPILYLVVEKSVRQMDKAAEIVRTALENLYTAGGSLEGTIVPSQFVLVDEIPCNANGKIDIFRITRERLEGTAYDIIPVRVMTGASDGAAAADQDQARNDEGGERCRTVAGIRVEMADQISSITAGILPEGMEGNSAFNLFDLFNSAGDEKDSGNKRGFGFNKSEKQKVKSELQHKLMNSLMESAMKIQGRMYHQKDYDQYFEESTSER